MRQMPIEIRHGSPSIMQQCDRLTLLSMEYGSSRIRGKVTIEDLIC